MKHRSWSMLALLAVLFAFPLTSCEEEFGEASCYLDTLDLTEAEIGVVELAARKQAADITADDLAKVKHITVAGKTLVCQKSAIASWGTEDYTIRGQTHAYAEGFGNELAVLRLFSNIESIEILYAPGLTDGSFMTELKNLCEIDLKMTNIRDFTFLREMPQLTVCRLTSCPVETIELPRETEMSFSVTDACLTDISFLDALSKERTHISLRYNRVPITGGMEVLKNFPHLVGLEIGAPEMDLSFLTELPALKNLQLCGVSPLDLNDLLCVKDSLEKVGIYNTPGIDLTPLDKMEKLTQIQLYFVKDPIRGEKTAEGSAYLTVHYYHGNFFHWFSYEDSRSLS